MSKDIQKEILKLAKELREKLRLLPKDILANTDLSNSTKFEKTTNFIKDYYEKLKDFEKSLDVMLSTIENFLKEPNEPNGPNDGKGKLLSYDFESEKPTHFYIEGNKIEVRTWKDLYLVILRYLYKKDKNIIIKLLENKFIFKGKNTLFSNTKEVYAKGEEIADNIYVETNRSAMDLIERVKYILNRYSMPHEAITIYIKEKAENKPIF